MPTAFATTLSLFVGQGLHLASCQYDSFGSITSMEGDTAENCSCRFFAEHHDPCFGLVYSHYNLTDCRRTSRDSIAEKKCVCSNFSIIE